MRSNDLDTDRNGLSPPNKSVNGEAEEEDDDEEEETSSSLPSWHDGNSATPLGEAPPSYGLSNLIFRCGVQAYYMCINPQEQKTAGTVAISPA